MFEPKIPAPPEGLEPLDECLEQDEPVILTFWNMPLKWAWEMVPSCIKSKVTIDLSNDECGHNHPLSGQHWCVLPKGHEGSHFSPLDYDDG